MIELLESRVAPATFVVSTQDDSGAGSLRQAIADANDSPGADLVIFKKELAGKIELLNGAINISESVSIRGPGPDRLNLDGRGDDRIFVMSDPDEVALLSVSGLGFFDGIGGSGGGAILSSESLKITDCFFKGNLAFDRGGAVSVENPNPSEQVTVEIRKTLFNSNFCDGDTGGGVSISLSGPSSIEIRQCRFVGNS